MWAEQTREQIWQTIDQDWDIIVIGGGITGAGILREAVRSGLRTLLVEQRDFAWGTSSRSSKMVHGGLRYLAQGNLNLMQTCVNEREHLLSIGAGLINPLGFLIPTYENDNKTMLYHAGLTLYDRMATQSERAHQQYNAQDFQLLVPSLKRDKLTGGFGYLDAQTDDSRLVMRVITEAIDEGGIAINYVSAQNLIRENGRVVGVELCNQVTQESAQVRAKVVINATGAWVDKLRSQVGGDSRIRPLRGSHLIFPAWRFPVAQAVNFQHPIDKRPVFAFPWEGVTLVGTTDLDHNQPLNKEPRISPDEVAYLMVGICANFPALNLTLDDVIASYAGVRPVIGTGKADPSKESRDHVLWEESGLLTVTGGKLTTYRVIALDTLDTIHAYFPDMPEPDRNTSPLTAIALTLPQKARSLTVTQRQRLIGRYGTHASHLIDYAQDNELTCIQGTQTLWAELRWACHTESVTHLDDLLLRRTRIGLLLKHGGKTQLPRIREISQSELGWDDTTWSTEESRYLALWENHYYLPERASIPNWRTMLTQAKQARQHQNEQKHKQRRKRRLSLITTAIGLAFMLSRLRRKPTL